MKLENEIASQLALDSLTQSSSTDQIVDKDSAAGTLKLDPNICTVTNVSLVNLLLLSQEY